MPTGNRRRILAAFGGIVVLALVIWAIVSLTSGSSSSPASTTTPSTTTAAAPSTTTGGGTTTTPSATSTTGTSTTSSIGGATIGGATSSTTSSATASAPTCSPDQQPDAHGLVTVINLTGPVTDGGTVPFTVTICKVNGDSLPYPGVSIGWSWDGGPASGWASLNLQPGVYRFWNKDASRPEFQLPMMNSGSSYTISGTVNVPDRGSSPAISYCLAVLVTANELQPAHDASGNPLPTWSATAGMPSSCQPYSVVR